MAIERVRDYFRQWNMEDKILEFEASSATVELAAEAVGVEAKRIAKTLSFHFNDRAILIVAAGDARVDYKKYKAQFGTKAKMLALEEVENAIGHDVGGVCPFVIYRECYQRHRFGPDHNHICSKNDRTLPSHNG